MALTPASVTPPWPDKRYFAARHGMPGGRSRNDRNAVMDPVPRIPRFSVASMAGFYRLLACLPGVSALSACLDGRLATTTAIDLGGQSSH